MMLKVFEIDVLMHLNIYNICLNGLVNFSLTIVVLTRVCVDVTNVATIFRLLRPMLEFRTLTVQK